MARREALLATAAVIAFLGLAGPANGQGASRQSATLAFTTTKPGASTGNTFNVDWHDPANPDGKPYSVARIVIDLAAGTTLDGLALPRCTASDAELYAQGAAACPAGSRTGGGKIVTDTGSTGGAPRYVTNTVDNFNGGDHLIGVADTTDFGPIVPGFSRVVSRSKIEGTRITFDLPAFPGNPPPDNYAAFKTLRLTAAAVERAGRVGGRTPATCPASGYWTNALTFTYRDGVSQRVESRSPCDRAGGAAGDKSPPAVSLRGASRRRCNRRRLRVRVRARDRSVIRRTALYLDGRLVHNVVGRTSSARRVRFAKRLRVRQRGTRHRLTVKARDAAGNRSKRTLRFRSCRSRRGR